MPEMNEAAERSWPPPITYSSNDFQATPYPEIGVVTWNINTSCNYRCSYCTQRFIEDRSRWLRDGPQFIEAFRKLSGRWEVKISGGEPFVHPGLSDIVSSLQEIGHYISIVTNFSASREGLEEFLESAGDRLRVFSASLHLEYVNTDERLNEFAGTAVWLRERLPAGASLNITCVATRAGLPRLETLSRFFESLGLRFKIQPEKQDREVIGYGENEKELILRLGGHNGLGEVAPSFIGRPCWAGCRSFTLDDRGNAWRCYPARRYRLQYLGNFLESSFELAQGPSPCLYSYCNCTVPIERGMMPRNSAVGEGGVR